MDMKINLVEDLEYVKYAIRDLVPIAEDLERRGMRIIYLNIGDPLKYDFQTPKHIIEAAYKAMLENKNYYGPSHGLRELREAIARHEKSMNNVDLDPDDIIITLGVSEAISFVTRILLKPGDEILIPSPAYPLYLSIPIIYNGRAVEYRMIEEEGWRPDIDDIRRKISDRTRYIVVINPNNPTGAVYSSNDVKEIVDLAGEYNIPIVSDEIYNKIIFDDVDYSSPASLSNDVPVFVMNGFSKAYLMTGWRVGYVYLANVEEDVRERVREYLLKLARLRLCINTPAQYAALAALEGPQDHIIEMNNKFRSRMELIYKRLMDIGVFESTKPKAAFYIFPRITDEKLSDDKDFAYKLLTEAGVFLVHGSGFGVYGRSHVRIVTLPPEHMINEAMDRIEEYISRLIAGS